MMSASTLSGKPSGGQDRRNESVCRCFPYAALHWLYQPSNCLIDDCPIARCDGGDSSGLVDELLPSFLAGIKNVGVGLEHAVGEIGLAQVLPDVLSRVEFRTCWRQ